MLFLWGGSEAARAAGRPIWLFGQTSGRDRLAATGFRAAFTLSFAGPLVWSILPSIGEFDPIWSPTSRPVSGFVGIALAAGGAMLAFAAQMSMGVSWRVGVATEETGPFVQSGLFRISRNPTFLGQLILLSGVTIAAPASPTILGAVVFYLSARHQIRQEEAALSASIGAEYIAYQRLVPRWIRWRT
ncbi:methyltransferase [Paracoccus aerodenitrificans]|nr:methyltransferase [Paracoccus aerodenitrificans]WBU64184.1 methyltransferase [Paracoccus aerodenitrificans]